MSMREKDKPKSFLEKFGDTLRGAKVKDRQKLNSVDTCSLSSSMNSFTTADGKDDISPISQTADSALLSIDELHVQFEQLLDDMNLKDAQKEPLRNSSIENKRLLLSQKRRTENSTRGGKVKGDSAQEYIRLLELHADNVEKLKRTLESLRVSLSNNPVSWIQSFGKVGLSLLVNTLNWLTDEIQDEGEDFSLLRHAQHECIKCFRAFMNNRYGLLEVFENDQALVALVHSLSFNNVTAMTDTIKFLAAVSLFNAENKSGFAKVLDAFTIVGELDQIFRFSVIVAGVHERENSALQDSCMQLINALVTQPDELDFRLHLRNEIIRTGLKPDFIEEIRETGNEDLKRQVEIFVEHRDNDSDEFYQRFENIRSEFDNVTGCTELLWHKIKDTASEPYLLSILQHFLLIRDDYGVKLAYFKLLEEVTSQIVLLKNGYDPDFRAHNRLEINLETTIESIVEKSKDFGRSSAGGGLSEATADELKKKLDSAIVSKQESDAKLSQYYGKIEEYMQEVGLLRSGIKEAGVEVSHVPVTVPLPKPILSKVIQAPSSVPMAPPPPPFALGGNVPRAPPPPPMPGIRPPPPLPAGFGGRPPAPPPPPGMMSGGPRAPPPPSLGAAPPNLFKVPGASASQEAELPKFLPAKTFYEKLASNLKDSGTKTRRFNWKPIAPQTLNLESFWTSTREEKLLDDRLISDIKCTFAVKSGGRQDAQQNGNDSDKYSTGTASSDGVVIIGGRKSKRTKELKVLDGKTAQSLAILQGSQKISHDEFCRALLEVDETKLYEATLQQLILSMPSDEQMKILLRDFSDKIEQLAEAEAFLVKLGSIDRLKTRLQCICFKLKFVEMINDVNPDIASASEACEEVRSSQAFCTILEMVLLIGNFLNANTTAKNGASVTYAFDIAILTKLSDTKSQDNKQTLLHFVVNLAQEKCKNASHFTKDFIHVAQAARFVNDVVQKQLVAIDQSINRLETELKSYKKLNEWDQFQPKMSSFLETAKSEYQLVDSMYKRLQETYASLAKYFAFDPKKYPIDEFFNDLKTFKEQFEQAVVETAKLKELQEKTKRAKEQREQAEREKQERQAQKKKIDAMSFGGNEEGVMDNLMEALRSGQAFPQRVRTPAKRPAPSASRKEKFTRQRSRCGE